MVAWKVECHVKLIQDNAVQAIISNQSEVVFNTFIHPIQVHRLMNTKFIKQIIKCTPQQRPCITPK